MSKRHLTVIPHSRSGRWHAIYIIEAQFHSLSIADSTQNGFCREINCRGAHSPALTRNCSEIFRILSNKFDYNAGKAKSRCWHFALSQWSFLQPSGMQPGEICNVICSIASLVCAPCMNFNDFATRGFSSLVHADCSHVGLRNWNEEKLRWQKLNFLFVKLTEKLTGNFFVFLFCVRSNWISFGEEKLRNPQGIAVVWNENLINLRKFDYKVYFKMEKLF